MVFSETYVVYGIHYSLKKLEKKFGVKHDEDDSHVDEVNAELKQIGNELGFKLEVYYWPCCLQHDMSENGVDEYVIGTTVKTLERRELGQLIDSVAIHGFKKGVKKYFMDGINKNVFAKLEQAFKSLDIEGEPDYILVPDDCYSCT